MTALIQFMASPAGRVLRAAVGVVLLVVGVLSSGATLWVLVILGLFFVAVGVFDLCVLAPLARLPLTGKGIRARHQ